jgi:hypothetical protein
MTDFDVKFRRMAEGETRKVRYLLQGKFLRPFLSSLPFPGDKHNRPRLALSLVPSLLSPLSLLYFRSNNHSGAE